MKYSLHLLITIKPAIKYYNSIGTLVLILSFILMILSKHSMKHSMTLNRTDPAVVISSNLISDLCFFSLQSFEELQ